MSRSLGHLSDMNPANWRDFPDWMLGPFWTGNFAPPELNPADFGSNDFHGRFHPAIPYLAMMRYTQRGEHVWDCFAGSGTTLDVGEMLGRIVIASDLYPTRSDILHIDASKYTVGKNTVDLGIMHPPYASIIDYTSPMSDAKTVEEFIHELAPCVVNMDVSLKPGKMLVFVIGEVWLDGELWPLEYEVDLLLRSVFKYRLVGRIVKDFGNWTQGGPVTNPRHANLWKSRLVKNGYFRYGIDTILFYQKAGDL